MQYCWFVLICLIYIYFWKCDQQSKECAYKVILILVWRRDNEAPIFFFFIIEHIKMFIKCICTLVYKIKYYSWIEMKCNIVWLVFLNLLFVLNFIRITCREEVFFNMNHFYINLTFLVHSLFNYLFINSYLFLYKNSTNRPPNFWIILNHLQLNMYKVQKKVNIS